MPDSSQASEIKRLQALVKQLRTELKPHRAFSEFMRNYANSQTRDKACEYLRDSMQIYDQDTEDMITSFL
jgi:hypothetical protein